MAQKRRTPEIIAGRVNTDGTVLAGDGFTVNRTGVGVYVLTFASSFRVVGGSASANGGNVTAIISALGGSSMTVADFAAVGGAAIDAGFTFTAVGAQT